MNLYNVASYGNNLEANLTKVLSCTGALRVNDPPAVLLAKDSGGANLQQGVIANSFETVPVLDVRDSNYDAYFDGYFHIKAPYLGTNQNELSPYSSAIYTTKQTDLACGGQDVGCQSAVFWEQGRFFSTNGISGG